MLADNGTPEHRHQLPTRLAANGDRVTVPIGRPTFLWIAHLVGLITLAGSVLVTLDREHHTLSMISTYTACVMAAVVTSRWMRRLPGNARHAQVCIVFVGLSTWMTPAVSTPPLAPQALFLGVGIVLTLAAEGLYRLAGRRCPCTGGIPR